MNIRAKNARGNQVQYGFLPFDHERVAGVMPALKANHPIGLVRQQVDNFSFAFITPLDAENDHMTTHASNRSLTIDEVEHNQPNDHTHGTSDSKFATVRMTNRLHHAPIPVRIHKRHDPFDNNH